MARTSADVAIIGGGLIGAFAAYFLRQHRRSVIVIEKATAAAAASGRNFGNLRLQGHDPLEFPLALRAQAIWEALPRLTGEDCGLRGCGHAYLALSAADAGKLDTIVRQGQAAGLAIEHLDGAAARRRWPWLAPLVIGASWSGRDAVAEPKRASPAVVRLAVGAGAELLEHTEVTGVARTPSGFTVTTAAGTIDCGVLVNAAGAWGAAIARDCGEPVPMVAAGPPLFGVRSANAWEGPALAAVDGTLLLRPGVDGETVAGSFPRVAADLTSGTAAVLPDRVERGIKRLLEVVPGLGSVTPTRIWSGVEGYLADMRPVIGWSGTTPGLMHAFGCSGHGFQLAPAVGAAVADLIATGVTETPVDAFAITRFGGGVVADAKLWQEFDPELVAEFRRDAGAADLRQRPQG